MTAEFLVSRGRSPLCHLTGSLAATGSEQTVVLTERAFRTMVDVRVDPGTPAVARLWGALGVPLPDRPGEVTDGDQWHVLWLGPDWYLVTGPPEPQQALESPLASTLRAAGAGDASVVDVSAHRTTLALAGPHARDVLEHGCPIDLHPRCFGPGRCAQTTLAKAQIVLHQTGPVGYQVLVRASYADYLARWLLDAMAGYVAAESVD